MLEKNRAEALCEGIFVVQNGEGYWYLEESHSGRVSRELFVSPRIAAMAMESEAFTWEAGEK